MKVRLHPHAHAELFETRLWYYERSPLSFVAFSHAVDRALFQIGESPNSFPPAEHGTRKFILQRFPFSIVYRVDETEITIVAVAHHKRRPNYWSDRVQEN